MPFIGVGPEEAKDYIAKIDSDLSLQLECLNGISREIDFLQDVWIDKAEIEFVSKYHEVRLKHEKFIEYFKEQLYTMKSFIESCEIKDSASSQFYTKLIEDLES